MNQFLNPYFDKFMFHINIFLLKICLCIWDIIHRPYQLYYILLPYNSKSQIYHHHKINVWNLFQFFRCIIIQSFNNQKNTSDVFINQQQTRNPHLNNISTKIKKFYLQVPLETGLDIYIFFSRIYSLHFYNFYRHILQNYILFLIWRNKYFNNRCRNRKRNFQLKGYSSFHSWKLIS